MKDQRYYIQQYGYYWSLNKDEFKQVLTAIINCNGYDLSEFRELKNKPSGNRSQYGVYIFNILDWSKEIAEYHLKEYT